MPVQLNAPLTWKAADAASTTMLTELQANIVRGHVRDSLSVLFFRFATTAAGRADARAFVRSLAPLVKSAMQHLQEIEVFKTAVGGSVYVGVGLSRSGYRAMGVPVASTPNDPAFAAGMKARRARLVDPASSAWDSTYQGVVDAVVLIGDSRPDSVAATRAQVLATKPASVTLIGEETGRSQTRQVNGAPVGIEHFGYMDGRSQPLFLQEDIGPEPKARWNPAFPLGQVILADRAAPNAAVASGPVFFGSYLVFRKLEQNCARLSAG